jgi:hypothetical protein
MSALGWAAGGPQARRNFRKGVDRSRAPFDSECLLGSSFVQKADHPLSATSGLVDGSNSTSETAAPAPRPRGVINLPPRVLALILEA